MNGALTKARPIPLALMFLVGVGYLVAAPATSGIFVAIDVAATAAVFVLFLFLFIPVQADKGAPLWLQNVSALALLLLVAAAFFRWADADWGRLGYLFFNFEVMSRPGVMMRMLSGLWIAVQVFLFSLVLATLLGMFMAVVRSIVNDALLNFFIDVYVDVFRAIPPIVLLLVTYSALPYSGIVLSPFATGVVALTLVEAAYLTEVFRAGIEAIHRNQVLSARSIGLTAWQAMRLVVLPQSVRIVLPDYSNRLIGLMKRTAETSVIAIAEILKVAQDLQSQFVNATPLIVGALLYMVVLFPMTRIVSRVEKTRPRT
ncbi:amine acid ABC transporter, permease protein, 3-TM region, His/Glu/Gln/Arg/opine family [Jannaschia faecimaris]|uniref:Amine acid ABC transporter, permease protein, 3-TM region, His/Glu/Gln/Arg/opine family n=1 Tax=Jannaschia faecimaris TaxID=1244108 RepID=A0A1H3UIT1_9RHOB|nr:amino acid ABC transporter permease [Jannaschia faecimaris]SDZ62237.1 amine acid ABC transporter, permease protein, 3-TM region, His/Glu/Gln/Arg/opine family [Jannaschia faecimaris]